MIKNFPGAEIREASDSGTTSRFIHEEPFDLVILDINFPGRNGLHVLTGLQTVRRAPPVLVLSSHSAKNYAPRCLAMGAHGYLCKDCGCDDVLAAITAILAGRTYFPAGAIRAMHEQNARGHHPIAHESLTNRELEVLQHLASGKTVSAVAATLSLSVKTVSSHRASILEKLGLTSTADIIRYALEHTLVHH